MIYKHSDHYNGRTFCNLVPRTHGFLALLRWMTTRQQGAWRESTDSHFGARPRPCVPGPGEDRDSLRITFVNHTTFLIQWRGVNILTDPVWSERASPVQWAGPRRVRRPGIRFEDLPQINLVLLSHDHYDHMDRPTLERLAREHQPSFICGLGNAWRLRSWGIGAAAEIDWWDERRFQGLVVTSVPAQHFSGRTPWDRDTTLWCGFVLSTGDRSAGSVYFAGDTGFGPQFRMVANRFPRIRASLLPIGAFRPEWFMGEVHLSPKQAVEAHSILRSPFSIASHFGTFPLADDAETEAPEELRRILDETDLRGTRFMIPEFGEAIDIPAWNVD